MLILNNRSNVAYFELEELVLDPYFGIILQKIPPVAAEIPAFYFGILLCSFASFHHMCQSCVVCHLQLLQRDLPKTSE